MHQLDGPHSFQPWRRRQEIWRLTKQLQFKKKLHFLHNRSRQLLPYRDSMVTQLVDYWQKTMNAKEAPKPELASYLQKFFGGKNVELTAQMLIKPVSLDLFRAKLKSLNGTSAPEIDGLGLRV